MQAPIVASREPDATDAEVQKGTEQSNELISVVKNFILRRTNALLSAHLPPKVPSAFRPYRIACQEALCFRAFGWSNGAGGKHSNCLSCQPIEAKHMIYQMAPMTVKMLSWLCKPT